MSACGTPAGVACCQNAALSVIGRRRGVGVSRLRLCGLIRKDDIEVVRSAIKIDEIIGEHVALRPAGIGSSRPVVSFHDERTPSFNVRPHLGMSPLFRV